MNTGVPPICLWLFLLSATPYAGAKECQGTVRMWPTDSIPTNGRIVLTGTDGKADLLRRIIEYNPRLVSEHHTVPLMQSEVYESATNHTQVVLVPVAPLTPNTTYRFAIDSSSLLYDRCRPNPDSPSYQVITGAEPDIAPPTWIRTPVPVGYFGGATMIDRSDCRPAYYITPPFILMEFEIRDVSACAIRVELEPPPGEGSAQRFWVTASHLSGSEHSAALLCSLLEFELRPEIPYSARFAVMDAAGNIAQAPSACTLMLVHDGETVKVRQSDCTPGSDLTSDSLRTVRME